jgi:hypothetical protein
MIKTVLLHLAFTHNYSIRYALNMWNFQHSYTACYVKIKSISEKQQGTHGMQKCN